MRTDIILLASGSSRRFQGNKLLYRMDGLPLIEHTLQKLSALKPHELIVVTKYSEIEELAKGYGAAVIYNAYACEGQSASIRQGIARSSGDQAMLCVGDQPYLKPATLRRMLELSDQEHIICVSCNGIVRNPAIFPRKYYQELLQLKDEQGGKLVMKKYPDEIISVECDPDEVRDIDERTDIY